MALLMLNLESQIQAVINHLGLFQDVAILDYANRCYFLNKAVVLQDPFRVLSQRYQQAEQSASYPHFL